MFRPIRGSRVYNGLPKMALGTRFAEMNLGANTRAVDGDIHVWHIPTCPPVPPATWVAPIILTDLRSRSQLHLDREGSIMASPVPDYRSDGGRERLAEVLEDSALMDLILAPFECP